MILLSASYTSTLSLGSIVIVISPLKVILIFAFSSILSLSSSFISETSNLNPLISGFVSANKLVFLPKSKIAEYFLANLSL